MRDYRYEWAAMIKPKERKIDLLYSICGMLGGDQQAIIMAIIINHEAHLESIKSLSLVYETMREKINFKKKQRNKKLFLQHRRIKLLADVELYRAGGAILRGMKPLLSRGDRRILKPILCDCIAHEITCELLIKIEDEDNE